MKPVFVLSDAAEDLELGKAFYESQEIGIGDYFVDSLLSDIESLRLFHGIHKMDFGFYRNVVTPALFSKLESNIQLKAFENAEAC